MKTGLLLLALVCLLVTTPMTAAAYEPTNGIALDANFYVTKITANGEVVGAIIAADEKSATLAVPMPVATAFNTVLYKPSVGGFNTLQTYKFWRIDRVHSRFG